MHFHDLRHTHKTWLIEDDIPEIAQAKRLGHRLPGVRGIYSHVTPAMQHRITTALQDRWRTTQLSPRRADRHVSYADASTRRVAHIIPFAARGEG